MSIRGIISSLFETHYFNDNKAILMSQTPVQHTKKKKVCAIPSGLEQKTSSNFNLILIKMYWVTRVYKIRFYLLCIALYKF